MTEFGRRLDSLIRERCHSIVKFCELVAKEGGTGDGVSDGQVGRIIRDERSPPLDQIAVWSKALRLTKAEADELLLEAELVRSPPGVSKRIRTLERLVEQQAKVIDELNVRVDTLTRLHQPKRDARDRPASR